MLLGIVQCSWLPELACAPLPVVHGTLPSHADASTSPLYPLSCLPLVQLPCTKSDVFEDGSLSFSQKRALMKLLQFALDLRAAEEAERAAREEEEGLAAAAGGAGNSSSAADAAGSAFGGGFSAEEVDGGDAAATGGAAAAAAPAGAAVGAVESLNERQLGTGRSLLRCVAFRRVLTVQPRSPLPCRRDNFVVLTAAVSAILPSAAPLPTAGRRTSRRRRCPSRSTGASPSRPSSRRSACRRTCRA